MKYTIRPRKNWTEEELSEWRAERGMDPGYFPPCKSGNGPKKEWKTWDPRKFK